MKTNKGIMAGAFALTIFALTGCNNATDQQDDAQKKTDRINEELRMEQEEYLQDMEDYRSETRITADRNDSMITDYRARLKAAHKENDADAKAEIDELEERNREMRRRMDEYQGDGKDNWDRFKEEFQHDMDELGDALRNLTVDNEK